MLVRSRVFSSNLFLFASSCKYPCDWLIALAIEVDDERRTIHRSSNRNTLILAWFEFFSSLFFCSSHKDPYRLFFVLTIGVDGELRTIHIILAKHQNSCSVSSFLVKFVPLCVVQVSMRFTTSHSGNWSGWWASYNTSVIFVIHQNSCSIWGYSRRICSSLRRRASIHAVYLSCWQLEWMVSFVNAFSIWGYSRLFLPSSYNDLCRLFVVLVIGLCNSKVLFVKFYDSSRSWGFLVEYLFVLLLSWRYSCRVLNE